MSSLLAAPALAMLVASCGGTPTGNDKGFATRSRDTLSPITLPGTVGKGAAIKTACHQLSGGNCTPTQIQTVAGAVTMLNLAPTSTPPAVQSWTSGKPLAWTDTNSVDTGQYNSSSSTFGNMVGIFAAGTLVHHSPWSFSGYINVGAASTRSFTVGSDDGFMLAISNGSTVVTSTKDAPRSFGYGDSSAQTWSTVTFPSAGLYPFEIIYYENEGQEGVQFIAASGTPVGLPGSGTGTLHGWGIVPASMVYAPDVSATLAWTNGSSTSTTAVVGTGTVIKYAATVTNNGTVPTPSTLTYTVSLPTATFSAASATAPCTSSTVGANFVVTCTMSALGVGASTTLNYQATLGTASNGQVIDTQGVVTGLSTAPEIAAAVGDTVGMYIYTTSTQTGGAATSTNTGNAPDSDVPATGLTDDDFNRVSVSTIVINAPTGTRSSLATQVISGTSNLPTGTTFTVTGTLSGGGTQTCTATVSAGGAWTCPATAFRDGSWSLTASATDGVDTTPTSAAFAMTVSAPSAPSLTAPANGALVSSATVALSGTSTEATGTTIQAFAVSGGTTKSCTATVTAGGTWTCNVTSLPDGTYTETAQVVEASGTLGPVSASRTFYANSAGFVSPVINQNAPALVATSTPAITGTAPSWETGAPYSLQVKDGSTVVCTINPAITPWSCNTSTLADGAHSLTAVLVDGSGATKASTTTDNITVDTTPPAKLTVTSSSGPFKTPQAISGNGGEVGASVTVKNGATVLCTATVQSGGTWSCTPGAMSDGNYSLTIFETDAAGNNSPTTAFNYIIDATPPSVTITATSPTNNNKPPLSGTASAAVSGVTVSVTVRDENNNVVCTPTVTSGSWSCTPGSAYADGTHTFTATATDGAGNTNTANKAVTIDATPPAITLTQPQYATTSTPLLTGTSEAGASVVVKDQNGTTMCSVASVPASGNWSCVSAARVDGTYTVTATATDSLNNSASTSKQLIIDTVAPGKLTVTSSSGPFKTPAPISGNGGEVGDAVFVKDSNSNVICQGTVQTGGAWSCTPGALADGNYTYQVTQVDPAGNVSQATSFNYIIDSQPPTVSISVTSPTANNKPALSGNAAATVTGVSVNVVVKDENGNTLCSATASGGTWSCTPTTAIADGAHTLTATATDGAGNTATASTGLTVDTTPPALTLVAGPYATTSTPVFSGTSEAGAKVVVKDQNGNTLCAVNSVPASGNWSCTSSALVDGAYTITATATDALNNAATASKPLTVDTVPPAVALTTAALTNSKNPAITGTAEVGASVVVKDENGNTLCSIASVPAGGAWSCPASAAALSDGAHTLTATATDAAGNTATSSKSMTVDTQAPAVALTTAALVSTHTPAISGAAEVGASVVVKDENGNVLCTVASVGSNGTFSCPVSASALADGAHTLTATATDAAGNTGTASKTMTVDTTAPAVALTTPAAINSTTPAISGTSEAGASVVVKDENGNVACTIASVPAGGAWSCPASASPLAEGVHTLTATATDAAGNLGVASKSITIDLTPPAKPTVTGPTAPVNDPSTPITGTGEPGATVSITDKDGAVVCTATVQGDGTWSCTPTSPLPEGDDTLTVVQTDPAGNRSAATDFTVTIDTSAPAITLAAVALQDTNLPVFSGTAEAGSTVVVTDEHGNTLCTVQTVPDDGHWSCTSASALADGTHTITATATDEAGNSASAHEDVTIDTHAPDAPTLAQVASPTANTLPTFSGTSEAGSTVAVIENGAVLCTALVAGDGTWACTSTVALTGGPATHTVDAVSTDPAGNVSQASGPMSFVVDTRTPTTPTFDQPDSPSNDPQQTLTGTAQSGATVVVKDGDGNVICTATAHADGTWSCTATLPEGSTDLTATSTLGTGPVSPPTGVHTIVIDTQAPAAPALTGPTAPVDTTTPVLHGTGEAGATVTVTDTDTHQVLCTAVVQSDGTWSCSAATLPQGATHVSVAQQDPAGNDSTSVTGVVVVDTIPPTVAIAAQGAPSNQPAQTLSGTAEVGSTVTVTSGAGGTVCVAVALSNGTWACSATLPEGQTNVSATAQDAAGNTATAGPVAYVIDTIPPTVPQIDTPDSPTSDTTPTFTGTGEAGTSVVVTEGGTVLCTATVQNDGTWSCDSTVALPGAPETHTITATGVDQAGNTSNGTTTTTVTVDTHVPVDPTIDPVASPTNDTSVTLTGTAEAGDTVVVTDGHGGTLCTTVAQSDGTWSCDVTLPDGSTTITATATTPAGVSGSDTATTTVVVDTTPPAVPTLAAVTPSPSNNTTPVFHGTGEAGSTVTVTEGSTVLCTAVVAQNGTWTCVSSALTGAPATHTVTATATDSAGNSSAASAPQSFVVDTRSPGAPTLAQVGSPTTNTQQTLTGTGAVGATVGVTDTTGRVVCTATVQSDGTWSCAALLPIGTSTMTATQTYGNGVLSPASAPITVEVDGVPPTGEPKPTLDPLPAQAGGAPNTTSDTTPTLTGTGVPGHTISVTTAAGDPVCATTVRPDGTWSCDSTFVFTGDPATVAVVHVVQTSPTGTASEVVTGSFTVDASTPAAPVIDAMASPSNEHKPTIAGTGKAGDTVTVVDGAGHTICTTTVDASGHWSCVPAAALPDGSVTFTATQTSPNGQTSPVSNAVTVVIGTTDAPTLDQPGTPTADNTPTFTGTATPGATVEVKSGDTVLCTATADASGHWSCTASPAMADGSYHVQAFEVHGDGSTSAGSAIRPLVIDTTAPGKPTLTAGPSPTTNTKPVLSGTAEAGSTVTITDEHGDVICVTTATASGTFACTPTQPLSEGAHTFTATATDAAGNTSQPSDPAGVVVTGPDNTAVTVAILGPSDGSTFETQPDAVHGVATPGATITVTFGDQTFTVTAAADGSWSVPLPTGLNGVYTVSAVATKGGHQSEIARSTFVVNGPQIVRGGCSTGGIPVEWLGLAMLLLLWPRRRQTMALARARKSKTGKIVFGVALVVALPGLAQTTAANAPNVNLRNFTPAPGGDGFAAVTGARPPIDGEGLLEVRLWADDAYQPLVVSTPTGDGRNVLINNRLIGWLGIQAHLNGPLSLAVQLPLTLQQSGSLQNLRSAASTGGVAAGIGDLRLVPRLSILRQETFGIDLAAEAEITIPTAASDSLTGDGRWDAGVTGSVGHRFDVGTGRAALDVVGNVFLDLRPPRQIADVKTGNELGLRAAVGFLPGAPSNWIPNRIFAEADTRTWLRAGFVAGGTPSEWRVGSGWCFARGFSMDGAIGTAIGNGIGSPKARFVFGFGYTPTACRVAEREAAHVPDPVLPAQRPVHLAVVEPPPDRDHDGIPDSLDKCPDVAGLKELDGCPKPPDRDGDGVADADDQCPDVAGPADNHGCPVAPKVTIAALPVMALPEAPPDADGDGVPDAQDNCPHDPGPKENQGCPLRVKQLVVIRGDKVDILEKVQFATGKAIIQPGSFKLLNQVATVLDAHPELTLVEVQGHTDNAGDPKKNQLLSQARADAVVRYLSTHGMDVKRLRAVGYGDQKPVVPNTSKINKEKNRRVEFLVLEMKARVVEVEKPQG